ncbi:MAG: fascin domain-containing protein [Thermoguttaceae bacterium]
MCRKTILPLCAVALLVVLPAAPPAATPAAAPEKVVLRTAGGRFLRFAEDGTLRAQSFLPGDKDTWVIVSRGKEQIALKAPGGRWLIPGGRNGRTPRAGDAAAEPGQRETFQLVPAGANRFALRPHGATALLVFDPADARLADPKAPASPAPRETVEIYRVGDLPAVLATLLPAALHTLAAAELAGKQYDKTQTHKTEKYVDLPDPRLTDLKHKKRHKVISVTEEDHVQAQLDGPADIHIPALPYLAGYAKDGPGVILLGVDARLPVRGHVQCKLPDLASASTGFRAAVELSAVAEVGVQRAGGDVKLGPPAVLDLRVSVPRLDLSNDVLETVRRQIRDAINRELRHNEGRIRQQANHALDKAMSSREVRIPLVGYLMR